MVIDSSAIAAIFFGEPERDAFLRKLTADSRCLISAGTLVEIQIVLAKAAESQGLARLQEFLELFRVAVVPFDQDQAMLAGEAFRRYGKGRHAARLNFGDCFSYALAKQTGEPLLFKGGDFGLTDVTVA